MKIFKILFRTSLVLSLISPVICQAFSPVLRFSDLISGPDVGLNDGLGSGVVVTVWGQHLGSQQGNSIISYVDADGVERDAAHVYYWKNADGQLPSGPANLYASHQMQEIAFSIPDSAVGAGLIKVTVNGGSSTLPFTVRPGSIYHIKSTGSDSDGDGSFSDPWLTSEQAVKAVVDPGGTVYFHDIQVGNENANFGLYWNQSAASSTLNNQFGFIAFPGTRPVIMGARGVTTYRTDGQVVSKFDVYSSNYSKVYANGQIDDIDRFNTVTYCFETDRYGRVVGNRCTDIPGGCASAQQAAITGNALDTIDDEVSGARVLGNEIYDYGCEGSSKLHHTTYLSVRSGDRNLQVDAWQFGWNYLHDNLVKIGLHSYDENQKGDLCGSPVGNVIYNDNVIINQSGAGMNVGAACPWTNDFHFYNNILINVGLVSAWDGVDVNTADGPSTSGISVGDMIPNLGLMGTVWIYNNTIIGWNDDDLNDDTRSCLGFQGGGDNVSVEWFNNVCIIDKDKPFLGRGYNAQDLLDNASGNYNAWYYSGTDTPIEALAPDFDQQKITDDPNLAVVGARVVVGSGSSLIGKAPSIARIPLDIYGVPRVLGGAIGAVEFTRIPNPPSSLRIGN